MTGFLQVGPLRREQLTKEWLTEKFGQEHQLVTGSEIPGGGYPDMGDGRYVMAAGYKFWYRFAMAQAVHRNYSESVMQVITCFMIAGLYHARSTWIIAAIYLFLRASYGYILTRNFNGRGKFVGPMFLVHYFFGAWTVYAAYALFNNKVSDKTYQSG